MKDYLGDSVYAEFDGFAIILTTENGEGPSNTICMEPEVMNALFRFKQRVDTKISEMFKGADEEPKIE